MIRIPSTIRCFLALISVFAAYWLLNYCAFPLFDALFIWTREISAIGGGCSLLLLALIANRKPAMLKHPSLTIFLTLGVGSMSLLIGFHFVLPMPLVFGAVLVTIGISLVSVVVGLTCTELSTRFIGVCVAGAYTATYALRWFFSYMPQELELFFFFALPASALILCMSAARRIFDRISTAEPPVQAAVTSPRSFIPFVHQVFITLAIFRFIYGFTLTFGETERVPLLSMCAFVPLLAYLAYIAINAFVRSKALVPDVLFRISILFSVAGFLALIIPAARNSEIGSTLLSAGTGFFEILMYFVLVVLATKNNSNALVVLTWGNAMASLGTVFGANSGRLANVFSNENMEITAFLCAGIVFGIVVYLLTALRNFSFSGTIRDVEPALPVQSADKPLYFDQRCHMISGEAGLTAREREIFLLLAQGRNARFIQEKLVVSYNTVKTHVSHIYGKLEIHNHQELIDLVEEESENYGESVSRPTKGSRIDRLPL